MSTRASRGMVVAITRFPRRPHRKDPGHLHHPRGGSHLRPLLHLSDTALGLNSGAIATAAFVHARTDDLPGGSVPGGATGPVSGGHLAATDVFK
ncbi:hypothetical protein ABZU75_41615 [Streptosporangium sp. NPDC005286]|uniref:hypothetical protein n=1 Tax=Streptosporangium sp. NPDC005286 TaxID=3154463 RepID=UPI0033A41029